MSSVHGATVCDVCDAGYYLQNMALAASQSNCMACPDNAACPWGTTIQTLVLPRNHWRLSPHTIDIHTCPEQGGVVDSTCTGSTNRTFDDDYCLAGHEGPRCEVCIESNEFFDHVANHCRVCPSAARIVLLCVAFMGGIVVFVVAASSIFYVPPDRVPRALQGFAEVARWFGKRSTLIIVRIGLQEKFKIIVSFARSIKSIEPTGLACL